MGQKQAKPARDATGPAEPLNSSTFSGRPPLLSPRAATAALSSVLHGAPQARDDEWEEDPQDGAGGEAFKRKRRWRKSLVNENPRPPAPLDSGDWYMGGPNWEKGVPRGLLTCPHCGDCVHGLHPTVQRVIRDPNAATLRNPTMAPLAAKVQRRMQRRGLDIPAVSMAVGADDPRLQSRRRDESPDSGGGSPGYPAFPGASAVAPPRVQSASPRRPRTVSFLADEDAAAARYPAAPPPAAAGPPFESPPASLAVPRRPLAPTAGPQAAAAEEWSSGSGPTPLPCVRTPAAPSTLPYVPPPPLEIEPLRDPRLRAQSAFPGRCAAPPSQPLAAGMRRPIAAAPEHARARAAAGFPAGWGPGWQASHSAAHADAQPAAASAVQRYPVVTTALAGPNSWPGNAPQRAAAARGKPA
eukprot:TRINITY_DN50064_c0_g1_i1.p1 TRINITY_DN50064_c0_g1~~TRINITY_DN50064_c0_g1_i1.p1  ORF type:complete len:445 (+),score=106.31 TRINITY_DN50064_c0_g1_i1:100-1335(+)